MLIKSKIKYIQTLSQKKVRDEAGLFMAEGPKIINELLTAGNTPLESLYYLPEWAEQYGSLLDSLTGSDITEVSVQEMERISTLSSPSSVLGVFKKPQFPSNWQPEGKIGLILDAIQDPGNIGTIIRSADWFGVSYIICHGDCADAFNPKVVQSTMGSLTRIRMIYGNALDFLQQHPSVPVYAALLEGNSIYKMEKLKEGIIMIGNESKGLRPELLAGKFTPITIPGKGGAESLNAAVATSVILSHLI